MLINIENEVLEQYPRIELGFLVAQVSVTKNDLFVEELKQSLLENLEKKGINATNFAAHQNLSIWRSIYQRDFQVNPKTYRSSIEALVRRIVTRKELWRINSIVDLYNCSSILSLLPMGGYDLGKISGNITIRFAKDNEPFQGIGERDVIQAKANHLVYADDKRIICWLWNYKDSYETSLAEDTSYALFFIDSAEQLELNAIPKALKQLSENLEKIGCRPLEAGILNRASSSANFTLPGG
jgi:DNA/RNA-binding domain of Phe-tRNA-synthetase-like protein